jgi:hypothetical protein
LYPDCGYKELIKYFILIFEKWVWYSEISFLLKCQNKMTAKMRLERTKLARFVRFDGGDCCNGYKLSDSK